MFGKKNKPPVTTTAQTAGAKGDKKWLLWSLLGFTGILLTTAVVLFFQINKPAPSPLPSPRPQASPQAPSIQQASTNACQLGFTVSKLDCTGVTMSPTGSTIRANDTRQLTATVTGGSGTYTHAWTITSTGTNQGTLSSTTTNPTTWTAPSSLSGTQTWTIKDTVSDNSTTVQSDTCEVTLNFGGLVACFDTCSADSDCNSSLKCQTVGGSKRCVNPSCAEDADCTCAGASPTPTPTPISQASPSPSPSIIARVEQPELPQAGVSAPAVLGVSAGVLLMLLGLLF